MIALLVLIFQFISLVQSDSIRSIFFHDGSKIQVSHRLKIRGNSQTIPLLLFSMLPRIEVEDRLRRAIWRKKICEFNSQELILLIKRIPSRSFLCHSTQNEVLIHRINQNLVFKFDIDGNFLNFIASKRTEACALNFEKFIFSESKCSSLENLKYGFFSPIQNDLW